MEGERKCSKCQKTLKAGVKCVKCEKWYHNKCESREPCDVIGYVCKICIKTEKNSSVALKKPPSVSNPMNNSSISALESENAKLKKNLQELSDRVNEQVLEIESLQSQLDTYLNQAGDGSSMPVCRCVENRNADTHSPVRPEVNPNPNLNNWTPVTRNRKLNKEHPGRVDLGARDVLPLQNRYSVLSPHDLHSEPPSLQENPTNPSSQRRKRRRRVLLLTDSHGRHMSAKLGNQLGGNFSVTSIVKPNAGIQEVTKCIEDLTGDFTSEDSVIILGGTNDVQNMNAQADIDSVINKVSPLSKKMNIIVSAIPDRFDRPELNKTIREMNEYMYIKMKKYEESSTFKFDFLSQSLNSQCFTNHGLHLNHRGKFLLCDRFASLVKAMPVNCQQTSDIDPNNNVCVDNTNFV